MGTFKVIPESDFEVSKEGVIRHRKTKTRCRLYPHPKGYVYAYTPGFTRMNMVKAHHLVARAWCPNPHGYREINHIDGDKANNRAENLEWCSRGHNIKHAYANGFRSAKGSKNARAVLDETKVAFIRGLKAIGKSEIIGYMGITDSIWQSVQKNWKGIAPTPLKISGTKVGFRCLTTST